MRATFMVTGRTHDELEDKAAQVLLNLGGGTWDYDMTAQAHGVESADLGSIPEVDIQWWEADVVAWSASRDKP